MSVDICFQLQDAWCIGVLPEHMFQVLMGRCVGSRVHVELCKHCVYDRRCPPRADAHAQEAPRCLKLPRVCQLLGPTKFGLELLFVVLEGHLGSVCRVTCGWSVPPAADQDGCAAP